MAFLLYHFTGLGGNEFLIKDFKQLGQQVQATVYEKEIFIEQGVINVLREELLLLMTLEVLFKEQSPADLLNIYHSHADTYNNILQQLGNQGVTTGTIGSVESGFDGGSNYTYDFPKYKFIPSETYYDDYTYPALVHRLSKKEQERVILILIDMYDLPVSKKLIENTLKDMNRNMKRRYKEIKYKLDVSKDTDFTYYIETDLDYRALECFSTLTKDVHLVFNKRIIEILESTNIAHPFKYLNFTEDEEFDPKQ